MQAQRGSETIGFALVASHFKSNATRAKIQTVVEWKDPSYWDKSGLISKDVENAIPSVLGTRRKAAYVFELMLLCTKADSPAGVGTAIMKHVFDHLKKQKICILVMLATEQAMKFYLKPSLQMNIDDRFIGNLAPSPTTHDSRSEKEESSKKYFDRVVGEDEKLLVDGGAILYRVFQ